MLLLYNSKRILHFRKKNMKSFDSFLENKTANSIKKEIATLMVEKNINPWKFLLEYYEGNADMIIALEEHKSVSEGFMDGVKRFGSAVLDAGKNMIGGVKSAAGQIADKASQSAGQFRAAVAGPEAHYAASLEALNALSKELNQNVAVQSASKTDPEAKKLVGNLQGIMKQLQQQSVNVKNILQTHAQQGSYVADTNVVGAKNVVPPGQTAAQPVPQNAAQTVAQPDAAQPNVTQMPRPQRQQRRRQDVAPTG